MRYYLFMLLFLSYHVRVLSQPAIDIKNRLYRDEINHFSIETPNYDCRDLTLIADPYIEIYTDAKDSCNRFVFPKGSKDFDTLYIKTITGTLISTQIFRIRAAPLLIATLDDISPKTDIAKTRLLSAKLLIPRYYMVDVDPNLDVLRYTVVSCTNGILNWQNIEGDSVTPVVREIIADAQDEDAIIFDDIRVAKSDLSTTTEQIKFYITKSPEKDSMPGCKPGQIALYQTYPAGFNHPTFKKFRHICPCQCADKADSTSPHETRYYSTSISNKDQLLRLEKRSPDSVIYAQEYVKGSITASWSRKREYLTDDYKQFHNNGKLKISGSYVPDTTHSSNYKTGTWQFFDTIGKISKEQKYSSGELSIITTYYYNKSQQLTRIETIDRDSLISIREFSKGQLLKSCSLQHKLPTGMYEEYHTNGKLKVSGNYLCSIISMNSNFVTNPVTLEEITTLTPVWTSVKSGKWQYFNPKGKQIKQKEYSSYGSPGK